MFNDLTSPKSLLATRRSGKPRDLVAPGPDADSLRAILTSAMRVPDHGKLAPWRFVIVEAEQRDALSALIVGAYLREKPDAGRLEVDAMEQFARQAPTLVVVVSAPVAESKIPLWEQELSAGAACMQLLNAIHAHGFAGGWLTAWPAFNDDVRRAFCADGQRIAGFVFAGSLQKDQEERPRPDFDAVVQRWTPPVMQG